VIMTRTADTAVDLWSRVTLAETSGAELLVSIHNNALPDGVNPFTNNGTTVFYNQPRSLPLAAEIQRALVRRLRLPDLGVGRFVILPDQEVRLRSVSGQRLYARGLLEGIESFLRGRARNQGSRDVGRLGSEASPRAQTIPSPRASAGSRSESAAP
jgi:N-acetylmuramoyl-L-alanine amidase